MGWVKRLADQVIQDRLGAPNLEFAWVDLRPADPASQSKLLDLYVRDGIYTVNEARATLGLDPVPGGDRAMVYGTAGATPLAAPDNPSPALRERVAPDQIRRRVRAMLGPTALRKDNPDWADEPRVPSGNPDGGEWADDGGSGGANDGDDGEGADQSSSILPAAYPGDYHDAVVRALKEYLTANGGKVITGVTLTAINGTSAVADMIVRLPTVEPFIVEVKTGPGAQFTDPQRVVYPMAQVGGHISSVNPALREIGLTPGELLPPLGVYVYWVVKPGERGSFIPLPAPEPIR